MRTLLISLLAVVLLGTFVRGGEPHDLKFGPEHLDRRLPEISFDGVGFSDSIDFLREVTGMRILVDWEAIEAANCCLSKFSAVNLKLKNEKESTVLDAVLKAAAGGNDDVLAWRVSGGFIEVSTAEAIKKLNAAPPPDPRQPPGSVPGTTDVATIREEMEIVDAHKQLFDWSCIPSSIELTLKLTNKEPPSYYDLQNAWKDKKDGTFGDFDGQTIAGLTYCRRFKDDRGDPFPIDQLFDTIDHELDQGRFVIVSLQMDSGVYHMFVIVDRTGGGDFRAVSKSGGITMEVSNVKERIRKMKGTDIMTYAAETK